MDQTPISPDDWPQSGLETLGHCPVCRSIDTEVAHDHCHDVVFGVAGGGWTVLRCKDCFSGFLDPRPTPETIGDAYSVYYTHESRLKTPTNKRSLKHILLNRIRGSYINAHYGRGQPSLGWLGRKMANLLPELRRSLDNSHRFLPFPQSETTPRLLDVGCGNGDFLKVAGKVGWTTFGNDPDPSALDVPTEQSSEIRQGGINVWDQYSNYFDAITMNHVVEHLHDPIADLSRCYDILKPGGVFYIETPNFDAYGRTLYGPNWRGLEVPRHLVIFTWHSLPEALRRAGFEIVSQIERGNFEKQAQRSAKCEAGIYDYQPVGDANLRLPTVQERKDARIVQDAGKSEWIGILARKPV
jgi:2-polyprenyl-3-methyl-5-hydroxy-6-metoxy-1,4-benzoquinol methylase